MISTGYISKGIPQEVPAQLQSSLRSHDVVVSRVMRTIRPNGSGNALGPGAVLDFNIASSSEWLDCDTAILHAKLTVSRVEDASGSGVFINLFPKAGWRSLISGYTLQCKGQSLEPSLDSGNLHSWNAFRSHAYESNDRNRTSGQLTSGMYPSISKSKGALTGVFLNSRTGAGPGDSIFDLAIPLKEICNFFNLDRSYLPIMAIPLLLRMTLNSMSDCFCSVGGQSYPAAPYQLDNVYISADHLTFDSSVDESFRRMVMESSVTFTYPSVFISQQSEIGSSTNINLKTNLNATNLDSIFVFLTENAVNSSSLFPAVTSNLYQQLNMSGVKYQVYIDSRNVFSEPIDSIAVAYNELQKAVKNENQQYLEGSPVISATGFISGLKDCGDINVSANYADLSQTVLACNLSRVLNYGSISSTNVSLTGGRIYIEITGLNQLPAGSDRTCLVFYKMTKQLVLSADFLQVIN